MSLSPTPTVAPVMAQVPVDTPVAQVPVGTPETPTSHPKKSTPKFSSSPISGTLTVPNENMGKFLGKGGALLKKYVTNKSAFQVTKAYEKDFVKESGKSVPSELGFILVQVELEKGEDNLTFKIVLHNDKENLSKYVKIVKNNLVRHAENFSKEKLPEDKFSHKIVFATSIEYEGLIGKFIGGGGKNIKVLSSQVKKAFNLPFCYISMKTQEDMARKPWGNKVIRLSTSPSAKIEVHVIVSMNLPRDSVFGDVLKKLTPIISESVEKLSGPRQNKVSEILASDFLASTSWADAADCYDPNDGAESPTYTPEPPSPW
jgi:hypothetical protein